MSATHAIIHVSNSIYPILLPLLQEEFDLSYSQLGLMVSIPTLFRVIASIPCGYLADRFTSKRIIALSFLIQIVSSLIVAWSRDPWTLVLSISLLSLTFTMYHPASLSYTTKLVSKRNRAKAIGMQTAGGPLGMALGPLSLSFLIPFGWRTAYLFWIIPVLPALVVIWRMKSQANDIVLNELVDRSDVPREVETSQKGLLATISTGLLMFLVFSSFRTSGLQFIGSFMSLYLTDIRLLSVSEASLILGSVSLVGVFAAPVGGWFSDKWGYRTWLLTALSVSILCIALAFLAPTALLFVVIYFSYRFFTFSGNPAQVSIVSRLMPPSHQGLGYALSFLPGSLVGSIIPTIAGILADHMGLSVLFPSGIAIMGIALILLKFVVKV
jgi:MFS family permease